MHACVPASWVQPDDVASRASLSGWLHRRVLPLSLLVGTVLVSMAFTLFWGPVVLHHSYWVVPGDIWGTFRTAQFVSWGDIGDVYKSGAGLVTIPGISVALAPVALVATHLNLSTSFPFSLAHPTAWLVLGPVECALGGVVLFPLDRLAGRLGANRRQRVAASVTGAVALWPVVAMWGHPEDCLALAFALWALLAALDERWRAMGWLMGVAIAMQPLVVLVLPVLVAWSPARERLRLVGRAVLPAVALVAIPLEQAWSATTTALLKQPNFPLVDHPTPWLPLAPVLSKTRPEWLQHFGQKTVGGGSRFTISVVHTIWGETVAAGPGRIIAIVLACLTGVLVVYRRPSPAGLVWLFCVALALRCYFEPVMTPYYLWPALAVGLVLAVRERGRFVVAVVAGAAMTWWSYRHIGPWAWWTPVVVLLTTVVVAASPARPSVSRSPEAPVPSSDLLEPAVEVGV